MNRIGRAALACALATACLGAAAGGAPAATVKLSVTPATIHDGDHYQVTVSGSYRKSELTGRAYLISLIQFGPQPCQPTAQEENQLRNTSIEFYFRPSPHSARVGLFLRSSPFSHRDAFAAGSPSARRVCAYLYPRYIGPADSTMPIATADARYRVLKK